MRFVEVMLISAAISADAFGAGLVYGLRRICAPWQVICVVGAISATAVGVSTWLGSVAGTLVDAKIAAILGGVVLVAMGAWLVLEGIGDWARGGLLAGTRPVSLRLKPLGLVVQIMRDPEVADVDRSGAISAGEAFLLGTALALDSLGTGLGAGLAGASWFSVASAAGVLTCVGFRLGIAVGGKTPERWGGLGLQVAPGIVLLAMGIAALGNLH
ncbi:MAG: manganese efflux pump [Firmicutes bacterium]|jgi:putative sporulation protein YtaF|nr:manganese efflux pump [Bacillota bacterium]MDD4792679.1 manganese efflux pump [Bacillota bacterium]